MSTSTGHIILNYENEEYIHLHYKYDLEKSGRIPLVSVSFVDKDGSSIKLDKHPSLESSINKMSKNDFVSLINNSTSNKSDEATLTWSSWKGKRGWVLWSKGIITLLKNIPMCVTNDGGGPMLAVLEAGKHCKEKINISYLPNHDNSQGNPCVACNRTIDDFDTGMAYIEKEEMEAATESKPSPSNFMTISSCIPEFINLDVTIFPSNLTLPLEFRSHDLANGQTLIEVYSGPCNIGEVLGNQGKWGWRLMLTDEDKDTVWGYKDSIEAKSAMLKYLLEYKHA